MRSVTWRGRIVGGGIGCLVAGLLLGAGAPPHLGVLYPEDGSRPAVLETRGRAVAGGELVQTLTHGAVLRLDNGQVLRLAANSSALLAGGADGDVGVTVLSGRVAVVDEAGRAQLAGQRSTFQLAPTLADAEVAERRLLALEIDGTGRRSRDLR